VELMAMLVKICFSGLLVICFAFSFIMGTNQPTIETDSQVPASHQENLAESEKTSNMRSSEAMSDEKLEFGNFSVSLAVKDLKKSKAFYEKLGFEKAGGNMDHNYLILQNETATIGLFQGMFEENILTFNPGWNRKAETLDKFQDVRDLQAELKKRGITPVKAIEGEGDGPASFVLTDPDGNSILIDQHVDKPK